MKKTKRKFAIAGAVESHDCSLDVIDTAKKLGKAIAKKGHVVITSARHGFPYFVTNGAKSSDGEVIYFSPAANLKEHKEAYRLDSENADMIIYTGFGYVGSQLFMTRSADAVIIGCGRLDSVHEFTLALQEGKPVGVLKGNWEVDEVIKKLVGERPKSHLPVIFEDNITKLIERLEEIIV